MKSERFQALKILSKVLKDKLLLSSLLKDETPYTRALCFGVCRYYYRLAECAGSLMPKRPTELELWIIILIGIYELSYLSKPQYATVKEMVSLTEKLSKPWAKGLINAVLRRFCREKDLILEQLKNKDSYINNHPSWLIAEYKKDWPTDWQKILQANDEHPPMSLRINQKQNNVAAYLNELKLANIEAQTMEYSSVGLRLMDPKPVQELPGFSQGKFSVQDEAAQLVTMLLDLQPGLRVLDACAAPGSKTCHILETEPQLELCLALDIDAKRNLRISENLKRLDLKARVVEADASQPEQWWDSILYDRILVDAPCSATGVIRRHPDIKLLRTPAEVQTVVELQAKILKSLWPLLKPGGIMVYCTCSVLTCENDKQIENFIAAQKNSKILPIEVNWGLQTRFGRQLLPGTANCDGFFYSKLMKTGL